VAAYAAKSGLDVSEVDYYVAFALWRWSCINEGMRARLAAAAGPDPAAPDPRRVEAQIAWQLERAWSLLRGAEAA
jgi:aminoglycoside phosphotransferase (APT) family kinase protein